MGYYPTGNHSTGFMANHNSFGTDEAGRARHSVRAALGQTRDGAHGVTRPTFSVSEHKCVHVIVKCHSERRQTSNIECHTFFQCARSRSAWLKPMAWTRACCQSGAGLFWPGENWKGRRAQPEDFRRKPVAPAVREERSGRVFMATDLHNAHCWVTAAASSLAGQRVPLYRQHGQAARSSPRIAVSKNGSAFDARTIPAFFGE